MQGWAGGLAVPRVKDGALAVPRVKDGAEHHQNETYERLRSRAIELTG